MVLGPIVAILAAFGSPLDTDKVAVAEIPTAKIPEEIPDELPGTIEPDTPGEEAPNGPEDLPDIVRPPIERTDPPIDEANGPEDLPDLPPVEKIDEAIIEVREPMIKTGPAPQPPTTPTVKTAAPEQALAEPISQPIGTIRSSLDEPFLEGLVIGQTIDGSGNLASVGIIEPQFQNSFLSKPNRQVKRIG